jgi:hypothetical protein
MKINWKALVAFVFRYAPEVIAVVQAKKAEKAEKS